MPFQQTGELAWHDPSGYRHVQRVRDIAVFWNNVVHNFPLVIPPNALVISLAYHGLHRLNGMLHWQLDPVFSQKAIFGKSPWLISTPSTPSPPPPPPRPPPPPGVTPGRPFFSHNVCISDGEDLKTDSNRKKYKASDCG